MIFCSVYPTIHVTVALLSVHVTVKIYPCMPCNLLGRPSDGVIHCHNVTFIAAGDKNSFGLANKVCPNIFHSFEYGR